VNLQDIPSKVPLCSCRNGAPVVLITQQRTPVPAKVEITSKETGDEHLYIVKVKRPIRMRSQLPVCV